MRLRRVKFFSLFGRRWGIRWRKNIVSESGEHRWGECSDPSEQTPAISVDPTIPTDKLLLEILIHEFTHAADWSKDETWVEDFSHDLAALLTRVGFRCG